jgi:mannosyltransferase OCH1-like enzyme
MIPKKIHYCWFGKNPKNRLIQKCISSWQKYLPDYEIIEWNEDNIDIDSHPFMKKAYQDKQWAFVADYARILVLKKEGGIYLDTDMEVIKSFDLLLNTPFFIGKESDDWINAGIIGSTKEHFLLDKILKQYDILDGYKTIPKLLTPVISSYKNQEGIVIYNPEYFYPYYPFGKDKNLPLMYQDITENTFAIHHWDKSWDDSKINNEKGTGICVTLQNIAKKIGILDK